MGWSGLAGAVWCAPDSLELLRKTAVAASLLDNMAPWREVVRCRPRWPKGLVDPATHCEHMINEISAIKTMVIMRLLR